MGFLSWLFAKLFVEDSYAIEDITIDPENLKAGKTHCEKDLCQPTATILFQDKDGEQLRLQYFSTWSPTISRKNGDEEKIGSSIRYGNLYFGHDNVSIELLGI